MSAFFSTPKFLVRLSLIVLFFSLLFNWGGELSQVVSGYFNNSDAPQLEISQLQQAQCLNAGQARMSKQPATGYVRFVGTEPAKPIRSPLALASTATAEDAARGYLAACGSLFGLNNPATDLTVRQRQTTAEGHSITRFQQLYQGIPVLAGETLVQTDGANNIVSVASKTAPNLNVSTQPNIGAATARQTALQMVVKQYKLNAADLLATSPALWIFSPALIGPETSAPALVWRIEVTTKTSSPLNELVLVDAQRGSVALSMNQANGALQLRTYTANDTSTLPGTFLCDQTDLSCAAGDATAKFAHQYAADAYNFFFSNLGRDSIDGNGMPITSTVHYSATLLLDEGAVWNGSEIIYNDTYSYTQAEDLVGHEINHGVIQYTSQLFNWYQSGAIAESLSDIFGELIQQTNQSVLPANKWLFGEDVPGAPGMAVNAIRNMKDPTQDIYDTLMVTTTTGGDPDRMTSQYYVTLSCLNSMDQCDNGYVHENNGVGNKAAYLMTDGGTFNGKTVVGLGITKVAHIYYKVETELLLSGSDYGNLYDALFQGCVNLVGQYGITASDCQQVRNATDAVEMNLQPLVEYNPKALICAPNNHPVNIFFDDMESGTSNWSMNALVGTSRWGYDSIPFNAYSGKHSLYANDAPGTASESYAAMVTGVPITTGMYLHFAQDYGFEYGTPATPPFTLPTGPDGGVVEFSINGGASWNDLNLKFDLDGYNGQIASPSNPLNGRSGFVNSSHGYNSSRADLSTLAGQPNVKFRWIMVTDSTNYNHGWWLDDVRIYTCAANTLIYLPMISK